MTDLIRPGQKIVHRLIAKTCKEIAAEVFEVCSSNDRFYAAYPHVGRFVAKNWRYFISDARKALTVMLTPIPGEFEDHTQADGSIVKVPVYRYPQIMRDEIFEALLTEGQMKAAPPVDLNQLRAQAGFAPPDYAKGHRPRRLDA
jgi:hypothetical protein